MNRQHIEQHYRDGLSLFATATGIGTRECEAIRRHAEREESRRDYSAAEEAYRAAALLQPGDVSSWRGLARCARRLGDDTRATSCERIADALERRAS